MVRTLTLALALMLIGCAGLARMNTYPHTLADAKVSVGHRQYSIWLHASEPTIMIQRGFGAAIGQGLVEGASLGAADLTEPQPIWRAAANAVMAELNCAITEIYTIDNDITWEARYLCPDGAVVSRETVVANRTRWRAGLQAANPMAAAAVPAQ